MRALSAARLPRSLSRFAADGRGVSAVEFALILPLMVAIYLGSVEITQAIAVDRKTTLVAHTVADLVAQESTISQSGISDSMSAATTIVSPYSTAPLGVTVSQIKVDKNGKATIDWSRTNNGPTHSPGDTVTLPAALTAPAVASGSPTFLIWGEASYAYKPMFGTVIKSQLDLGDSIYMHPRQGSCVLYDTEKTCPTS